MAKAKTETTVNKSEAVRKYAADNPEAGPKEISEALAKQKPAIEVAPGRVSAILRQSSGGKVDTDMLKKAAEFAGQYEDLDAALTAIGDVGEFIDACGNSAKAKKALETFKDVKESMGL